MYNRYIKFSGGNHLKSVEEQLKSIKRGVVDMVTEADLAAKLKKGKPLNIKLGIDPTGSDIHLGHTVPLNKLRQFQDLGHKAILIIGDYTAMIGDPSGRMSDRPQLTHDTIMKNVETYKEQAYKILDKNNLEIVYNGSWFGKMSFADTIRLVSKFTLAQMMEHDSFDRRFKEGIPLSLHELVYPIMQGYDSVMIKADIELGGTDQRFNLIAGRYLQKESGMEQQVGLFTPILTGLDGKNKMSKSLNNYIGINDKPEDMFGKVMSIPDGLIAQYFELLTDVELEEIDSIKKEMAAGKNPVEFKKKLGYEIVKKYNNNDASKAEYARGHFEKAFGAEKAIPYGDHKYSWVFPGGEVSLADFLKGVKAVASNSDARRLVEQGGFYINDARVDDFKAVIKKSSLPINFKAGKKLFGRME